MTASVVAPAVAFLAADLDGMWVYYSLRFAFTNELPFRRSGTSTLCAQQLTDTDAEPIDRHSRQPRGTHAHRDLMSNTARARQRFGKLPEWASTRQLLAPRDSLRQDSPLDAKPPEKPSAGRVSFPEDFRFGMATSAYQIEGAVRRRSRSVDLDTFCARAGPSTTAARGRSPATTTTAGNRIWTYCSVWASELPVLHRLAAGSAGGPRAVNQRGLDFYRRLVDGLAARHRCRRHLVPLGPATGAPRRRWVGEPRLRLVVRRLRAVVFDALDGVDIWLTINEPKIIVQQGYQLG